jgi:hypothetical protein
MLLAGVVGSRSYISGPSKCHDIRGGLVALVCQAALVFKGAATAYELPIKLERKDFSAAASGRSSFAPVRFIYGIACKFFKRSAALI